MSSFIHRSEDQNFILIRTGFKKTGARKWPTITNARGIIEYPDVIDQGGGAKKKQIIININDVISI